MKQNWYVHTFERFGFYGCGRRPVTYPLREHLIDFLASGSDCNGVAMEKIVKRLAAVSVDALLVLLNDGRITGKQLLASVGYKKYGVTIDNCPEVYKMKD